MMDDIALGMVIARQLHESAGLLLTATSLLTCTLVDRKLVAWLLQSPARPKAM